MAEHTIHIFHDQLGFFTNKTIAFIESIAAGKSGYLNTAANCRNKNPNVHYTTVAGFLRERSAAAPSLVVFHSYSIFNRHDIRAIRAAYPGHRVRFAWIFWSHEYYQLPEFFSQLYQGFSRRFYLRKILSFHVEYALMFLKGRVSSPFYPGLAAFKKTFAELDVFCSFVKGDYEQAMQGVSGPAYGFISYLDVRDFPDMTHDFHKARPDVMVGHAGSPIVNHYEMVETLSRMGTQGRIVLPLAYGKASYIRSLQQKIQALGNPRVVFQTTYVPKDEYYRNLETVGYFILNSYCQQALGNIVFFLWNGTKVFLREETSTYRSLRELSFHVFSIEADLNQNGLTAMSPEQKMHNHRLISELMSVDNVRHSWSSLLGHAKEAGDTI